MRRKPGPCRRENAEKALLRAYTPYYNLEITEEERPLIARAEFVKVDTSYVLSEKHQLWSAESFEYAYLFSVDVLTAELYDTLLARVLEAGMKKVVPKKGHRCSVISIVIVCDRAEPDAVRKLKKSRRHKEFRFSLDGWMDLQALLVVCENGAVYTNGFGRSSRKFLHSLVSHAADASRKAQPDQIL